MSPRARWNPLRLRQLALMLVLALGMAAQSLLGVMGDLHESVLHADAGEAYTHQHVPGVHHDGDRQDADHGAGGALHLLEHQSCGGHCTGMAGTTLRIPTPHLMVATIAIEGAQRIANSDYTAPFRPPIQA